MNEETRAEYYSWERSRMTPEPSALSVSSPAGKMRSPHLHSAHTGHTPHVNRQSALALHSSWSERRVNTPHTDRDSLDSDRPVSAFAMAQSLPHSLQGAVLLRHSSHSPVKRDSSKVTLTSPHHFLGY